MSQTRLEDDMSKSQNDFEHAQKTLFSDSLKDSLVLITDRNRLQRARERCFDRHILRINEARHKKDFSCLEIYARDYRAEVSVLDDRIKEISEELRRRKT